MLLSVSAMSSTEKKEKYDIADETDFVIRFFFSLKKRFYSSVYFFPSLYSLTSEWCLCIEAAGNLLYVMRCS